MALKLWNRKRTVALDELGGTADGSLVIVSEDGTHFHVTPPPVASSLRFLLVRLRLPDTDGLPERVAITAALRGEGVSYMTRSLASVIAYDTDDSVAVVDLNWTDPPGDKPDKKELKSSRDGGPTLADAVEQSLDVSEIIRPTSNPRLSLVAAGDVAAPRRPAMAGSRALEEVIGKLGQQFDHLLLDLPPVLASSDAIRLAQLADGFVLVVQQGVTAGSQVEGALGELVGVTSYGVVLNRFDSTIPRRLRKLVGG